MLDEPVDVVGHELGSASYAPVEGGAAVPWERSAAVAPRGLFVWVFVASFAAHVTVAARLRAGMQQPPSRAIASQVEIEVTWPPPPPPPTVVVSEPPRPSAPVASPTSGPRCWPCCEDG